LAKALYQSENIDFIWPFLPLRTREKSTFGLETAARQIVAGTSMEKGKHGADGTYSAEEAEANGAKGAATQRKIDPERASTVWGHVEA
jgi:hypothetical protein